MRAIGVHLHLQLGRLELVHRHQLLHVDLLDVDVGFVGFGILLAGLLTALARLRECAW